MNFDAFIGIPWVDKACGLAGCDCWGLVRLIYRERRGVELPAFSEHVVTAEDSKAVAAIIAGHRSEWDEVRGGDERLFDLVTVRRGRDVDHLGVVIEPGRMIHVALGSTSCVERYRAGKWQRRVDGFFRYRG